MFVQWACEGGTKGQEKRARNRCLLLVGLLSFKEENSYQELEGFTFLFRWKSYLEEDM
jgi:hypothetical protein